MVKMTSKTMPASPRDVGPVYQGLALTRNVAAQTAFS